jgi:hypothetical protein
MRRRLITVLALVCAIALCAPGVVIAASGSAADAITDCNDHAGLTAQYSVDALRQALATMPVDVREYTDCYDVIQKQLFAELGTTGSGGSGTTGGSSSGSVLPTPLLVILILLVLAALTFGAIAIRRRSGGAPASPDDDPTGSGGSGPDDDGA